MVDRIGEAHEARPPRKPHQDVQVRECEFQAGLYFVQGFGFVFALVRPSTRNLRHGQHERICHKQANRHRISVANKKKT
jgi:hypothetical protein